MPPAWQLVKALLDSLKLGKPSDPDFVKITTAMEKAKKGMEFRSTLVGDKTLTIEARIGSTVASRPFQADPSSGGVTAWRAKVQLLHDSSQLVDDAELAKFQKAHPDPTELARVRDRLSVLNGEVVSSRTR